ncbi:MAG: hypothetical protein HYT39_00475 [Candidatus Sungbacteria bacterium]|nr:hypothetical protein [Candidatus Sungbacteria bacterium]
MTSRLELEKVFRHCTTDPELMAGFYEAAGVPALAHVERKKVLKAMIAKQDFAGAVHYHQAHNVLSFPEFRDLLVRQYRWWLGKKQPFTALEVAREHNLTELAREAAVIWGEEILRGKGHSLDALLKIARCELADDKRFQKRAARLVFRYWVRSPQHHGSLPRLVSEFRPYFSDVEADLAEFLADAEKDRNERRYARPKVS